MQDQQFVIEDGVLKAYLGSAPEVRIPEGIHTIGDGAFKGMAWLKKVTFPSTLKVIGNAVFKGCRQLSSPVFPEGLTEIGEYAFHRCHGIEELIFPETVTKVGGYAFLYCDGVGKVVAEGPKRLGRAAFSHNMSLQEIALNKDLDYSNFSEEVFEGCVQIRRITLSGEICEIGNLIEAMDSHSAYPEIIRSIAQSVYHSLEIEDGVLNSFNINLKSVCLPEGITAVGKSCFLDKMGIERIIFPESLREIRANAFLNCSSLEEVTFPHGQVLLDEKAFRGCCNLKKVNVGSGSFLLEEETANKLAGQVRDQVLGDFLISGRILIRYMGDEEQIKIPRGVEIIGERCFFGKEQLKIVICPDSLQEIREQAFTGCVTLQNVVLPDKLRRIEREAFAECRKLLKCNIPDSLEFIGEYAFRRCFALKPFEPWPEKAEIHPYAFYLAKQFVQTEGSPENTGADLGNMLRNPDRFLNTKEKDPQKQENDCIQPYSFSRKEGIRVLNLTGVKNIGKYAWYSCPDLTEISIDAPECIIGQNAFSNCPKLKKVRLNVKEIGKGCFAYCRELTKVQLSGVSVLPQECFAGCYLLSVFEAKEITRMGSRCFDECIRLDSFDFSGITAIGERAFERCDFLKKVQLDRVECGFHAFADCAALEEVGITDNTVLKSGAFIGCTQIKTVVYDSETYEFSRFSDGLNRTDNPYPFPVREVISSVYSCFDIRGRKILTGYSGDAVRITIPQDVEEIGQDVFRDHSRLHDIRIPGSVKTFGAHAFFMTAWLEEQRKTSDMVIVNAVLLDGAECKGKVELPSTVKRVAAWCFAGNTNITELVIPSERISIESLAFRNCLNLKRITDWNGKEHMLCSAGDLTEKDYPETVRRIFTECINCFKLDEYGNLVESTGNITHLTFPEGIKSIGDSVYKDCHLLEQIDLSTDTGRIGKSAFENSKWLKHVTNAGAVTFLGAQAFSGCQSLENIDLSDRLTKMGSRCFEHCCNLKEIHISGQLSKIPERAFFRCKALRTVYVPESVKVIDTEAFAFCDGLEEIYIPEDTVVSESAFAFCDRLKAADMVKVLNRIDSQ